MSALSFITRVTLWAVAAFLFVRVAFVGVSRFETAVFVIVLVVAFVYTWFDKRSFDALIGEHAMRPFPRIKKMIDGSRETYQIFRDTYYHRNTPKALVHLLDALRDAYTHVQIHYGNAETGLEKRVVTGYIKRSIGSPQILLLVQLGEAGSVAILDHHIVQLIDLDKEIVRYQHPAYHQDEAAASTDGEDSEDPSVS